MEFRVLGPVDVEGGPRRRAVLAVLLLPANESVSAGRLVADVWGEDAAAHPTEGRHADEDRVWRRLHDELLGPVRGRADPAAWERAAAQGAAMSLRDVVELVRCREVAAF
jgi:hypothetical protein